MATVNSASLRDEFDADKADIVSLRKEGEIIEKTDKVLTGLCDLVTILTAAFLEKTTKNSSIPPSQTGKDETRKPPDTSKEENSKTSENFETVTVEEVSTVETCGNCGNDLSDVEPTVREERVLYDLSYKVTK